MTIQRQATSAPGGAPPRRAVGGFTLVELLVVTVLGALVVGATLQILITNQRTYTAQNAKIQGQQATRAAMEVLFGELREVSAQGGDLLAMSSDSVSLRVMRNFGVVCDTSFNAPPTLDVLRVGGWFQAGDSVYVFADNNENISTDDAWISGSVTAADTTISCGTQPATEVQLAGQLGAFQANLVSPGAPIRAHTLYTYGLFNINGENYLGRREPGSSPVPIVGPVRSGDGVEFTYLDQNGNATGVSTNVRQIQVTVRTASNVRGPSGGMVSDSITGRIFLRN